MIRRIVAGVSAMGFCLALAQSASAQADWTGMCAQKLAEMRTYGEWNPTGAICDCLASSMSEPERRYFIEDQGDDADNESAVQSILAKITRHGQTRRRAPGTVSRHRSP